MRKSGEVLPDTFQPDLKVVFCGTAAGERSAELGAYYAGPGNQFWSVLHRIDLTPRQLKPEEFGSLAKYDIGLTDLAKKISGADDTLHPRHFDSISLVKKIEKVHPRALAFNGKRAAQEFYGRGVDYGCQVEAIAGTIIFVLPSTSGAARGFWDERYWSELAAYVRDGD